MTQDKYAKKERHAKALVASIFLVPLLIAIWYYLGPMRIVYRLTVDIDVAGDKRSASSNFRVDYSCYSPFPKLSMGTGCGSHYEGVAPLFDLGARGTLAVAINYEADAISWHGAGGRSKPDDLPLVAYNISVFEAWKYRFGPKVVLQQNAYPAFIWIPSSNDWRQSKLMQAQDIRWVDPEIRIERVVFTPNFFGWVSTSIDPPPTWLLDLRKNEPFNDWEPRPPRTWRMSNWNVETLYIGRSTLEEYELHRKQTGSK